MKGLFVFDIFDIADKFRHRAVGAEINHVEVIKALAAAFLAAFFSQFKDLMTARTGVRILPEDFKLRFNAGVVQSAHGVRKSFELAYVETIRIFIKEGIFIFVTRSLRFVFEEPRFRLDRLNRGLDLLVILLRSDA